MAVEKRLMHYASFDTQSSEESTSAPSTEKQLILARELKAECEKLGFDSVELTDTGIVYAYLNANTDKKMDRIGFIAHMDTATEITGANVKCRVISKYDGNTIQLNEEYSMSKDEFPALANCIGDDLIVTDGTTLLGADDKAGIAIILEAMEQLIQSEKEHGFIAVAFTPDEEVSGLAKDLDLERFKSPIAYTLDGDHLGYYMDETFNASLSTIEIHGISVHTATAKGIMKNAVDIGNAFLNKLPVLEKPQYTQGREGFYHVVSFNGDCEYAKIEINVRDHDSLQFDIRNNTLKMIVDMLNEEYGQGTVNITQRIQYRNLKEVIDQVPFMIPYLKQAIESVGLTPQTEPFRGGTDGSALSHRGLPCPNLSAGYENAHGRFEYVPIQSMEKNVEILLNLIDIYAKCDC